MSADESLPSKSTSTLSAENFSVIFVAIIVLILVFVGTTSGRDNQRFVCAHSVFYCGFSAGFSYFQLPPQSDNLIF